MNEKKVGWMAATSWKHASRRDQSRPAAKSFKESVSVNLHPAVQTKRTNANLTVFRPQILPGVMHEKTSSHGQRIGRPSRTPIAPPVYSPQPIARTVQCKLGSQQGLPEKQVQRGGLTARAYRPESKKIVAPRVALMVAATRTVQTPPRYRPQPTPKVLQTKSAQIKKHGPCNSGAPGPRQIQIHQGKQALPRPFALFPTVQRAKARRAEAGFIYDTSKALFAATVDSKLMEVQSSIFDGRMFVASNYSKGEDNSALGRVMGASYSHASVTYTGRTLVSLVATLHAEQQILKELAKVIKNPNKDNPAHVNVMGSKRPCSVCRRVLLAFHKALADHYPFVQLHFVNQTGADTAVAALDLGELAEVGGDPTFNNFVATYTAELGRLRGIRLSGEEVGNAERTAAVPSLDDLR
jgi:hypothetical protein